MRRWVLVLGVLLVVGGAALVGARAWFISEIERHKDVLFLGVIGGAGDIGTFLDVALYGGIGLGVIGVGLIVGGRWIRKEREVEIWVVITAATLALVIAIPAAMFAIELGRTRSSGVAPVGEIVGSGGFRSGSIANPIGCADGERDAFVDQAAFPRIAGCTGRWRGAMSLRKAATGEGCGDDIECESPADLCAVGWHVCASPREVMVVTAAQCSAAGDGRWFAAMSSSAGVAEACEYGIPDAMPCLDGANAQPVCCGDDCVEGRCKDAVWKGGTLVADHACSAMFAAAGDGVLCCPD